MIFLLKITVIGFFIYFVSKGLSSKEMIEKIEAENETEAIKNKVREAYALFESEKRILVNTIRELREELTEEKMRREKLLEKK